MHLLFILTLIYAENINLPNPINSQPKEENKTEQKESNPSQQSKENIQPKEPSKPEPKGNDNSNLQQKEGSKNESKGFDLFSQQNKENKPPQPKAEENKQPQPKAEENKPIQPKAEENKAAQSKSEENTSTQSKGEENKSSSIQSMSQSSVKSSIQTVFPLSSSISSFPSVSQSTSATSSISSSENKQSDKSLTESKQTEKMPGEQISSKEIQESSSKENKEESSTKKDKKCLEMDLNMPIKLEIKISPKDLKNIKSIESMLEKNKQEDSKKVLDPENKKEENQPEKEELIKSLQPNQGEMSPSPSDKQSEPTTDKKNEPITDKKSEPSTDKQSDSSTGKQNEQSSDKKGESSTDKPTTPENNNKIEPGLKLFCALIKNVDLIKEKIKPFFQVNKVLIFKNDKNEFMDYWGRFKFTKQNEKFLDETGFFVGEEKESLAKIVENGKLTKIGFYQNKNITQQESENDLKNVQDLLKKVAEEKKVKIEDLLNDECPLTWVDKMLFEKEFNKNNQPVQVVVCVKKEGEDNCESLENK